MKILNCEIISSSDSEHLRQLHTGFSMLHRQKIINLRQTVVKKPLGRFEESHLRVRLNNQFTLYYDMHDCGEILPEYLEGANFYFKRSYARDIVSAVPEKERIFPFGFNYAVFQDGFDRFAIKRSSLYEGKTRLKNLVRGFGLTTVSGAHPQKAANFEDAPKPDSPPKVIFMARAWNPEKIENKAKREETEQININRAECVRLLRKEFGRKFFGGLAVDDYSRKYFSEYLLTDESLAHQKSYLKLVRNFPICVATKGLCESNGWKLAEYIALSKAIISERLCYETVGDFAPGRNYLEFTTPEECVRSAVKLFEDKHLSGELMWNNFDYYQNFLRPDKIVLNTLLKVQSLTA